ncbi:MAG TPA: hypothetical protein VGA72_12265 [Anaerolineales bacterium]
MGCKMEMPLRAFGKQHLHLRQVQVSPYEGGDCSPALPGMVGDHARGRCAPGDLLSKSSVATLAMT